MDTQSAPQQLQRALCEVAARARAIDIRSYERRDRAAALGELVPLVAEGLDGAIGVLGRVLASYEGGAAAGTPQGEARDFYREMDSLMTRSGASRRVADLTFMARMELGRKRQGLECLGADDDAWKIISECGSGRRHLIKSATAVETALCAQEGFSSSLEAAYTTEVQLALEVRRAYTKFRKTVCVGAPRDAATIEARLRHAAVCIAKLVGRDVYEDLRVGDRVQIRALQDRVMEWLRGADGRDPRSGLRLWQDLSAFAELLTQVNNRAELRDHDARLAAALQAEIRQRGAAWPYLPEEARRRAGTLYGRDESLDRLIERPERSAEEWKVALEAFLGGSSATGVARPVERAEEQIDFI